MVENIDDDKKQGNRLLIGIALGASIGIFGNLWVGALLNLSSKDFTTTIGLFFIGMFAWILAMVKIIKLLDI